MSCSCLYTHLKCSPLLLFLQLLHNGLSRHTVKMNLDKKSVIGIIWHEFGCDLLCRKLLCVEAEKAKNFADGE